MTPTTLIMAYYENSRMLAYQYEHLRTLPVMLRDLLSVIIVDDGSPKKPAFAEDLAGINLQVYRMREDIRWNQDACRNVGVKHSEKDWLLLTDMDHMVPQETFHTLLLNDWDAAVVYQFRRVSAPEMDPYKPHPNTWFMSRKMYEQIGGYDERFAGYYGTDAEFRDRVRQNAEVVQLKENIIRFPRSVMSDASTTTYLRKQPEDRMGLECIRKARDAEEGWKPLQGRFEYDRVHP